MSQPTEAETIAYLRGLEDAVKGVPGSWGRDPQSLPSMVFGGYGGQGYEWLRQLLPGSDYDYQAQAGDLWRNSAVAACLRVLKTNFPQPRLEVHRIKGKGKDKVLARHPLPALFDRPNPHYDRYSLWGSFVLSAVVDGNAYLLKIRSRAGVPVELWWTAPWTMRPVWNTDGSSFLDGYEYRVNGRVYLVPPEDVIHFRHGGIDPRNDRLAMSELKAAAARSICSLNEVDGYTASVLRNMGIVPVVISPVEGGRIGRDEAELIKGQWRERTTGERRGEPFVNPGAFTVAKIAMSPEEMALDKLPARLEDQISALTGVPGMVAGLTSGAQHKTYANYAEARRAFYEDTLIPLQAAVAECLCHQLLGDPGMGDPETQKVAFSYDGILCLQEDQDKIHLRAQGDYEKGLITRAEGREMIGLDWEPTDEVYIDGSKPGEEPPPPAPAVPPGRENDVTPPEEEEEADEDEEEDPKADEAVAKALRLDAGCGCKSHLSDPLGLRAFRADFKAFVAEFGPSDDEADDWIKKYRPCRDKRGRFTSCGSGGGAAPGDAKPSGGSGGGGSGGSGGSAEAAPKPKAGKDMAGKPAKEIKQEFDGMSSDWRKGLSDDEQFAVKTYTGESFGPINAGLRKGEKPSKLVKDLDGAIAKSPLKEDTVVYRGVGDLKSLGLSEANLAGATIGDKGFTSTSLDRKVAEKYASKGGAVMRIVAPKGTKGASVSGMTRWPKESEVVFARGSKLKVSHATREGGRLVIHAELVQ